MSILRPLARETLCRQFKVVNIVASTSPQPTATIATE